VILTAELNQELPLRVFLTIGYVLSAELTRHCLSHITTRKRVRNYKYAAKDCKI